MIVSSWNVRGLRGDRKMRMVKDLKRKHRLNMLRLIETKRQLVTRFDVLKIWENGCAGWEYVGSEGASGGLLLMWDDDFFRMKNCYKGDRWLCVEGVLSENSIDCAIFLGPSCFLGDFNEITQVEERRGFDGLPPSAQDLKDWINDMGLVDLPITDCKFTWFKGRSYSRIDRVLVSLEWLEVELRGLEEVQFTDKLKALTVPLEIWHRDNFGDIDKKIMKYEEEIKKIDDIVGNGTYDGIVEARRKALVTCCEKWYVRKELHWKQMSRSRHARHMDKNTRYFHNLASARRRNNRIDALIINGRLIRNQARIKIAIREFYKGLYNQEQSSMVGFRDGLVEMTNEEDALALEMELTPEEVKEGVWDCESSKALGNDRYNMIFIKKCWDEIVSEFTAAVLGIFQSSRFPTDANVTWVALAPKFTSAKEIKDLRLISMSGLCIR
ncbi:uncharacterized protein LOC107611390 [Arachis ipaensis]|uniref:uncharacterized protein LOC107611390 n=1 Tax=Arachis ipaensis TaxID=130454 RepID=UPI0007AF9AA5|nr:uncharacterized protein LOC107611390 [Arachis ipaensis]XP_025670423.1 uncharacterized protein LOC112770247 [Arachis hypogaea]